MTDPENNKKVGRVSPMKNLLVGFVFFLFVTNASAVVIELSGSGDVPRLNGSYDYNIQTIKNSGYGGLHSSAEIDLNQPHYAISRTALTVFSNAYSNRVSLYALASANAYFSVDVFNQDGSPATFEGTIPLFVNWNLYVRQIGIAPTGVLGAGASAVGSAIISISGGHKALSYRLFSSDLANIGGTDLLEVSSRGLFVNLLSGARASYEAFTPYETIPWFGIEAIADPTFYIDPSSAFADLYSLRVNSDFRQSFVTESLGEGVPSLTPSSVPAPSSFALLALGLVGLGLSRKRIKQ